MDPRVLAKLQELAGKEANCDAADFSPVCGNYDDAYSMGARDGSILLARSILKMLDKAAQA